MFRGKTKLNFIQTFRGMVEKKTFSTYSISDSYTGL